MPLAPLPDRSVLALSGPDRETLLDGLVTCSVRGLTPGEARYGALLTPQGKIIADFLLTPRQSGDMLLIDVARSAAPDLFKRLAMYRLRSQVTISDVSADLGVFARWGSAEPPEGDATVFRDPRFAALGTRIIAEPAVLGGRSDASVEDFHAHRIALAIPEGGRDVPFGDAFPHEAAMDQLGGVDFAKGCYVGQEVVSRMQHRGTARTRIAAVSFAGEAPPEGAPITAAEKPLGRMGTSEARLGRGLALARLDRLADAVAAGAPVVAGGMVIRLSKPAWATYAVAEQGAVAPA